MTLEAVLRLLQFSVWVVVKDKYNQIIISGYLSYLFAYGLLNEISQRKVYLVKPDEQIENTMQIYIL